MKKKTDPESMAAMEIVAFDQAQAAMSEHTKGAREKALQFLGEMSGRIKTTNMIKTQMDFFTLLALREVKDAKEYREKLDMTWEQYCNSIGLKRRTVDDQLEDLKPFKAEFLAAFRQFSGFEIYKIKHLGEVVTSGGAKIVGNSIIYGDESVALLPENKDEVQALIEKIESDYKTKLDDTEANLRANKKIVKQKDDLLVKQEKDLRKFEKRAEGRGLSPEEDAFEQQMENFRIGFDGYMTRIDPARIEELQTFAAPRGEDGLHPPTTVTPRMRAAYIEALGYMRRQIIAAYDTANEMYGADMEAPGEAWRPGGKS